jgi:predicted nuclease of predicted toxin-antitoxin system
VKLLLDQNISFRTIKKIEAIFPLSSQVRLLGLENAADLEIWNYAKENNYAIVTFDTDFFDLSLLYNHPPKIIWLRIGNHNTSALVEVFEKNAELINEFLTSNEFSEIGCLEIDE